jgi:lysozyme
MTDTWNQAALVRDLSTDEGCVLKPYKDTAGKLTIGIGRNLTDRGITLSEADFLLANDIAMVVAQLDASEPWWRTLDAPRQRVMLNLGFNMGVPTLITFHQFLDFMQKGDWQAAAEDLKGTAWYGEVRQRGPRTVARLLAGVSDAA